MKMRILLCALVLGLLTVVKPTPVHTSVTRTQSKAEEDFLTEVMKDGFIVRQHRPASAKPTASMPHSAPAGLEGNLLSQESSGDSEVGSGGFGHLEMETTVSTIITSRKTLLNPELEGSGTETGSGNGAETRSETRSETLRKHDTDTKQPLQAPGDKAADGDGLSDIHHKGHTTPGWIIILTFVVALAALVLLCVAIATREKWNGPRPASQQNTKNSTPVHQRMVETQTLLNRKSPEENRTVEEYTVIPLDELPEKTSQL